MSDVIFSLLVVAALLWILAPTVVIVLPRSAFRLALATAAGVLASSACCAAGVIALLPGDTVTATLGTWFGLGDLTLRVDPLSGFFLVLSGGTSGVLFLARAAVLPHARGRLPIVALAGLLLSLMLLFIADNAVVFLMGWEGIAVCFYLLVASGHPYHGGAVEAAQWTMVMTKLGGAAVLAALLCFIAGSHGIDFAAFREHGSGMPLDLASAAFILALIGFGVKVAILPLQSWLPRAYPAAPVGAPAFLAAVALNAGFYGFIRITSFLGAGQVWWGLTVLLLGALTAFGGILYAAIQTNLKALISYSSVENVGIILCGIGASMAGRAVHSPVLASLGLIAALAQVSVHTVVKAALFVCADGVERHTGTADMERLGGLARSTPATAAVFLLAAITLIGLPPFGGFVSEWLTLETLMQGFRVGNLAIGVSMAMAGALLALTAALAGVAFVSAFFSTFLGMPRTGRATVRINPLVTACGAALVVMGAAFGVGAPWLVQVIGRAESSAGVLNAAGQVSAGGLLIQPAFANFSSIAPTLLAIVVPAYALGLLVLGALVRNRKAAVVRTPLWNSGSVPAQARTQYTPTAWSNPIRVVFDSLLRTRRERVAVGPALIPSGVRYRSAVPQLIEQWVILPPARVALEMSTLMRRLQSGSLARYLLYVLIVLAAVLILIPANN